MEYRIGVSVCVCVCLCSMGTNGIDGIGWIWGVPSIAHSTATLLDFKDERFSGTCVTVKRYRQTVEVLRIEQELCTAHCTEDGVITRV